MAAMGSGCVPSKPTKLAQEAGQPASGVGPSEIPSAWLEPLPAFRDQTCGHFFDLRLSARCRSVRPAGRTESFDGRQTITLNAFGIWVFPIGFTLAQIVPCPISEALVIKVWNCN